MDWTHQPAKLRNPSCQIQLRCDVSFIRHATFATLNPDGWHTHIIYCNNPPLYLVPRKRFQAGKFSSLPKRPKECRISTSWSGWWFGTFFIFHNIWNNHPNWLVFFRGVETTNQWWFHQTYDYSRWQLTTERLRSWPAHHLSYHHLSLLLFTPATDFN
jgi:hypothetical protein